jgi:hypothetical protein
MQRKGTDITVNVTRVLLKGRNYEEQATKPTELNINKELLTVHYF